MTDETIIELLSRHIDGDLDPHEERELTTRLEEDPTLAARLQTMRDLRSSVAALAAADEVPAELDRVIEPLLSGRPEPLTTRPWARWLATAAVIVLGATVVIEVHRRNPTPGIESLARMAEEPRADADKPFALAPLPTSSVPVEEQPLGASDRLLASPIPEIELEEPRALEVLGPLAEGDGFTSGREPAASQRDDLAAARAAPVAKGTAEGRSEPPDTAIAPRRQKSEATAEKSATASEADAAIRAWDAETPRGQAKLFVFIDGKSAWREFTPSASCKPGRYTVRIVVSGGVVREARPVGGATSASPSQRLCAAELIVDLEIVEVADGEYPAEVVVERRSAGH